MTIAEAYAIDNEARRARRHGFAPAASRADCLRAKIVIQQNGIDHPFPFAKAYATPTNAERLDQIAYLERELARELAAA
jgi:hypothetical protein